jgi:integrase
MGEERRQAEEGKEQAMSERRARGEGQIRARGSNLQLRYYRNGLRIEESTKFANTEEGRKKAAKLLRQRLGEVAAGIAHDSRGIRYEDLREAYLTDYRVNGRKSLRFDKSGDPYLDKVNRLDDFFAGYRAIEIDADLIRKFITDQQSKGLSNGSVNRSISALRRMFNLGVEDGRLRNVPHFPMLKESAPRQGFFERDQYESLRTALPDYLRLPLAIGFFTGMREGEILGLKWDQIDWLGNAINLRAGETKNDEGRTIPIIPTLKQLLLTQYSRQSAECPYVCFRLDSKGRAVKIMGFRKAWYGACVKCGLGKWEPAVDALTGEPIYDNPRRPKSKPKMKMVYNGRLFHDLRRSGVRNLVRAGVPERVAMNISGHKTRSVFERYNIVSERDLSEAARKLADFHNNGDNSGTISTELQQVSAPTI